MKRLAANQTYRECRSCQRVLPLESFHRRSDISNRRFAQCKTCRSVINKDWRDKNKPRIHAKHREWYLANKEKKLASNRQWIEENLNRHKTQQKEYRARPEIKARLQVTSKEWDMLYPERRNARVKKYNDKLRATVVGRLANCMRSMIYHSLKGRKNGHHWETLVGYTAEDLRSHIESLWEPWMSWDNWGICSDHQKTWQIDHIRPISSFNITNAECDDFKKCWSINNLRPIPALENILKKDKI